MDLAAAVADIFERLGLAPVPAAPHGRLVRSPIDGSTIGSVPAHTAATIDDIVARAARAQLDWRAQPAPRRGEIVRRFGEALRIAKEPLGRLVAIETGKILAEGLGEVQEMIDICDFAVGLSRQLHGLSIASERPQHKMFETWHPLGVCAVITAFNFPVAVWAWNTALALVCGNAVIWKPSEKTPLTAIAAQDLLQRVLAEHAPEHIDVSSLVLGDRAAGQALAAHPQVRLVSATGSTAMGRAVGELCARSFKRSILELGGNNAAIVCPSADLDLALRAITFAAVGTAGQRCTSLRRLFVHADLHDEFVTRLQHVYARLPIGNPLMPQTLVGPLIDAAACERFEQALHEVRAQGAVLSGGERMLQSDYPAAHYVRPALVQMPAQTPTVLRETFAPILYVMRYDSLPQAIALNNDAHHGLSSSIFTTDLREAELFTSPAGSDCGIANVNIGTSGAEIGGAFGGEKDTGGGRESGSDAWKGYMRRATNTINYGRDLPLAQGLRFELDDRA